MDMDIDDNDIAVFDWRNGGMPIALNTSQTCTLAATPSKSSSKYRTDDKPYHFGSATSATTSYSDQHYPSYYVSGSYANGSTSHNQYQYNYGSSSSTNNGDHRTKTAVSGASNKEYLFDLDNIEEIDYSDKATLNPDGTNDIEEIDYSNFSLDDVEEIDYSKETAPAPSAPLLSPPTLSANGVEIVKSPKVSSPGLVVPKPSLPLKESISDEGAFKSINGALSKQSASSGRKRKREECERGQTPEDNELVDLLAKSNFRVSSRLYAKPARKASNDMNTSHSTDRASEDGCPTTSASSSFSNLSMNEANESYNALGKNCIIEETKTVNNQEYPECPLLRIRSDIFEDEEED